VSACLRQRKRRAIWTYTIRRSSELSDWYFCLRESFFAAHCRYAPVHCIYCSPPQAPALHCFKKFHPLLVCAITYFDNIWQKCCQRTLQRKNAMLTYLMLSLAVGYQLKCCYGSRLRRSNAWLTPGATVSHRWSKNWPVAQMAQGLCESQWKALWTLTVTVWIVLSVLWLDFQRTSFLFEFDVFHWEY